MTWASNEMGRAINFWELKSLADVGQLGIKSRSPEVTAQCSDQSTLFFLFKQGKCGLSITTVFLFLFFKIKNTLLIFITYFLKIVCIKNINFYIKIKYF